MTQDSGFENGEVVPTVEPHYFDELPENFPKDLQELINRKIEEGQAIIIWEAVARFAIEVMQHKNPKLTLAAFCFAAGLYVTEGKSETQLAKEMKVTRAALSKRIVEITKQLGLPPSRGMKSEKARDSYSKAQINRKTK